MGNSSSSNDFQIINSRLKISNRSIETLELTNLVIYFPDYCFKNCSHLKILVIPNSVVSLGDKCF
jgi:hypothetical protein